VSMSFSGMTGGGMDDVVLFGVVGSEDSGAGVPNCHFIHDCCF